MSFPVNIAPGGPKRVLIVATTHWVSTARLVMALAGLGCQVELMAPAGHPALATGMVATHHRYVPLAPMAGLRRALRQRPDLLLLSDELSFLMAEDLAQWAQATDSNEAMAILALLRRSFGRVESIPLTRSRMDLLAAACSAGVPIPATAPLHSRSDVSQVAEQLPGPWMLKADSTWGGFGVRKVTDQAHLPGTWKHLQQPLDLLRSLKRGWSGKEWGHLHVWLKGDKRDVIAQTFIPGTERTGMAVCTNGEITAAVCFEVEEVRYANGPASIVRVVEDEAMLSSMRRTTAALGLSGFCGFDFMLEAATGVPLLLEMNMRPTQLAHLPLGAGRDLCAALVRNVLGESSIGDRPNAAETGLVALFPQELLRDPSGARLGGAFHDVPWAAPRLVRKAMAPAELPTSLTSDPRWFGASEEARALGESVGLSGDHA